MKDKDITLEDTLRGALQVLNDELHPNSPTLAASTQYRKSLAVNLFYKVVKPAVQEIAIHLLKNFLWDYIVQHLPKALFKIIYCDCFAIYMYCFYYIQVFLHFFFSFI